ncbi:MAG: SH3 domain-containing protein [Rhizobiaceae bacterium]|nr:SH3 domain-containing protein [Rhizobiaceae bacterium]
MRHKLLTAITLTALVAIPAIAEAAEGFATANVNMRSGPSTAYPAVTLIPYGTPLEINGCLQETPWCDVSFEGGRGWVAGSYIQATYQSRRIYVGPQYYRGLGIPTVTFDLDNYWGRYYRGRDFYRQRDYWRRGPGWGDRAPDTGWDRRPDPGPGWDRRPDRNPGWDNRPGWDNGPDQNWDRRPDRNRDWGNQQDDNGDWRRQRPDRSRSNDNGGDNGGNQGRDWGNNQRPDRNRGGDNQPDRRPDNNRGGDQQPRPQPQQGQNNRPQQQRQQGQPGPYSPDHTDCLPNTVCNMAPRGFNR